MYATMFFRIKVEGFWCARNSKPCLQAWAFPYYGKLTHGKVHASRGGMGSPQQQPWVYQSKPKEIITQKKKLNKPHVGPSETS